MPSKLIIATLLLTCTALWADPEATQTKSKLAKDAKIGFVIMVGELTMSATNKQFQAIQNIIKNSSRR